MGRGHEQGPRLGVEDRQVEAVGRDRQWCADDEGVDLPVGQGTGVLRAEVAGADVGVGMPVAQIAYGGRDDQIVGVPDGDRARRRGGACGEHRLPSSVQELLRLWKERRAGGGEPAALGGALQQAYAEGVLQPLYLTAQGGLGDP